MIRSFGWHELLFLLDAQRGVRPQAFIGNSLQDVGGIVIRLRQLGRDPHQSRSHRAAQGAGARAHHAEQEVLERTRRRIPDPRAVEREIDGAGHDLVGVMIEAAAAQEPRCVQHEAAGQVLKLRARELRDMQTDTLSAVSLLPAFVCATQVAFSGIGDRQSPAAQPVGSPISLC